MGAEVLPGSGVHFRVWAPVRERVEVVLDGSGAAFEIEAEGDGWFSGTVTRAAEGTRYRYRLDGGDTLYPDPVSRYQPEGPHGPSQVVDPSRFRWNDAGWTGPSLQGQVIYEMHVGTFTREGTWEAAERELPALAELGVTAIELMPVADFPGERGWGYDGVDWFAPTRLYGTPDDMRRFVDRAHALGLAVLLDVVYNHFGPDGAYWREFSPRYFSRHHTTEWGDALNFDEDGCEGVREFVTANARYWIQEFHLDGLRLDATQDMHDDNASHVVADIVRCAREAAGERTILLIAENEPQHASLVRSPEQGGLGLDAVWNDDFHHSAIVAVTGRNEAYYMDTRGRPQELISAARWGFLFQGQFYAWQKKRRGRPAFDLPARAFVNYTQNHDQIANSAFGLRLPALTSAGRYRAITALHLLAPGTPLLFQGQEFASSSPFLYFCDHNEQLASLVRSGRTEFLTQFSSFASPEIRRALPDPTSRESFLRSKLDHGERESHAWAWRLHRDLLALRREHAAFRQQRSDRLHGAVLGLEAFLLRYFADDPEDDRLLLINLGRSLHLRTVAEPLLSPVEHTCWRVIWSSEHPDYGGMGTPAIERQDGWRLPGHSAVVLAPGEIEETTTETE